MRDETDGDVRRWVGAYRAQERSDLACPACAACGVRDPHLAYSERGPLRDLPARHWMRTIRTLHHAGDDGHVDRIGTRLPVVEHALTPCAVGARIYDSRACARLRHLALLCAAVLVMRRVAGGAQRVRAICTSDMASAQLHGRDKRRGVTRRTRSATHWAADAVTAAHVVRRERAPNSGRGTIAGVLYYAETAARGYYTHRAKEKTKT